MALPRIEAAPVRAIAAFRQELAQLHRMLAEDLQFEVEDMPDQGVAESLTVNTADA